MEQAVDAINLMPGRAPRIKLQNAMSFSSHVNGANQCIASVEITGSEVGKNGGWQHFHRSVKT